MPLYLWVLRCCLMLYLWMNFLGQKGQVCGFSPLWIFRCLYKELGSANSLWQISHFTIGFPFGPRRGFPNSSREMFAEAGDDLEDRPRPVLVLGLGLLLTTGAGAAQFCDNPEVKNWARILAKVSNSTGFAASCCCCKALMVFSMSEEARAEEFSCCCCCSCMRFSIRELRKSEDFEVEGIAKGEMAVEVEVAGVAEKSTGCGESTGEDELLEEAVWVLLSGSLDEVSGDWGSRTQIRFGFNSFAAFTLKKDFFL